jgi:hypothetical protein
MISCDAIPRSTVGKRAFEENHDYRFDGALS